MIKLEDIDSLVFNGGEVHVKNVPEIDILFAKIRNSEDLMKLLLVTDAHKREYGHNFKLFMPYIPYARQDRVANEGEALSIKVFSDLINTQNYEQIYVLDPHSDTCMATLNNVKEIAKINDEYLAKVIPHYEEVIVVAPDAGAFKRLSKTIKRVPLIYATKNRNTVTGELSNVEIHTGGISIAGKRLLIVDDICDGGGTFILLAKELIGTSIPASEHSIMCCNSAFTNADDETREYNAYKRIITEVHPTGIVSIVSDTWNLWDVLTKVLPKLKPEIMNRDGKLVVRPDSGDPADIVCGINSKKFFDDYQGKWKPVKELTQEDSPYYNEINKGVIELLWETFGGTINEKGYKVLDPHIGCIYGDAITMERAEEICERLAEKGFASSNIVFGIGSYTYQMNTRDTFGFALKSTYAIKNNREVFLYKDPITDNGVKKSQKGRVWVKNNEGLITFQDGFCEGQEPQGNMLEPLFINGELLKDRSLSEIRQKLKDSVKESDENDRWVNSHFMYDLTGAI